MSLDIWLTARITTEVHELNITHNLGKMASAVILNEAGLTLYDVMWRPDEHEFTQAKHIYKWLKRGLKLLKADPDKYKAFNPENEWGDYYGLVRVVELYTEACKRWRTAKIHISR